MPGRLNMTHVFHMPAAFITICLLLFPFSVQASDVASVTGQETSISAIKPVNAVTDPVSTGYLGQLVVGLVIVLLCIIALAWVARRFNRLQSTPDGSLRILGGMSMGARERIVLVQVGTKQLLLGVAPGRINTLHTLDEPLEAVTDAHLQHGRGFAEKLATAINRGSKQ